MTYPNREQPKDASAERNNFRNKGTTTVQHNRIVRYVAANQSDGVLWPEFEAPKSIADQVRDMEEQLRRHRLMLDSKLRLKPAPRKKPS